MAGIRDAPCVRGWDPPVMNLDLYAHLGARIYDPFLALGERRGMAARRAELLAQASGRVLELGAGTGLNLPHYTDAVHELVLSEPDAAMGRRLGRRVARAGSAAVVVAAPAERLPFDDASFDTVVSTMVLCTVADAKGAVHEVRRVLRPDGRLLFIEHVRADSARLARWQDRLARPWRAFAMGCRANQPTLELLATGGLRIDLAHTDRWCGMPAIVHPLAIGRASRA
jgi:ubiquinone/menaquinone biosynthesis C-methylase UbiE